MNQESRIKGIKAIIHYSLFIIHKSQKGFTLIELMVVLSITAVLGILGIAGFTKYNEVQVLQTSANNLVTTLNLARSRAASQVKPSAEFCVGQLDGYAVKIVRPPDPDPDPPDPSYYTLNVVCSGVDSINALQTTALPKDIIFAPAPATDTTRIFFPVLSGKVKGGTIVLSGYEQTKKIVVNERGIFASAAIPTPIPTATIIPTPIPTSTPIPSPTPTLAYKRVFVTSTTYNGALGGLLGADTKCQTRANDPDNNPATPGLGGTWKAWLSDSSTFAFSRLTHATVPYKLIDGTLIAKNWTDLTDDDTTATPINAINKTETGGSPPGTGDCNGTSNGVWTSTHSNGTSSDDYNCSNWSSSVDTKSWGGIYSATTNRLWTSACRNNDSNACSKLMALYCFEQ